MRSVQDDHCSSWRLLTGPVLHPAIDSLHQKDFAVEKQRGYGMPQPLWQQRHRAKIGAKSKLLLAVGCKCIAMQACTLGTPFE